MKHISHIIRPLLGLLLLLPAACTQDDLTNRTGYGVGEGQMSLQQRTYLCFRYRWQIS